MDIQMRAEIASLYERIELRRVTKEEHEFLTPPPDLIVAPPAPKSQPTLDEVMAEAPSGPISPLVLKYVANACGGFHMDGQGRRECTINSWARLARRVYNDHCLHPKKKPPHFYHHPVLGAAPLDDPAAMQAWIRAVALDAQAVRGAAEAIKAAKAKPLPTEWEIAERTDWIDFKGLTPGGRPADAEPVTIDPSYMTQPPAALLPPPSPAIRGNADGSIEVSAASRAYAVAAMERFTLHPEWFAPSPT
jgi:hypothetical protein